jgi:hypothetical protein
VTTVFTLPPWRKVHDINVKSGKGRRFAIDIYQDFNQGRYETMVTVFAADPTLPGIVYTVHSAGPTPADQLSFVGVRFPTPCGCGRLTCALATPDVPPRSGGPLARHQDCRDVAEAFKVSSECR